MTRRYWNKPLNTADQQALFEQDVNYARSSTYISRTDRLEALEPTKEYITPIDPADETWRYSKITTANQTYHSNLFRKTTPSAPNYTTGESSRSNTTITTGRNTHYSATRNETNTGKSSYSGGNPVSTLRPILPQTAASPVHMNGDGVSSTVLEILEMQGPMTMKNIIDEIINSYGHKKVSKVVNEICIKTATRQYTSVTVVYPTIASPEPTPALDADFHSHSTHINYTTLTGFFLQDNNDTDPSTFDYTTTNFGLINRNYPNDNECDSSFTQWQKFEHYVANLNAKSGKNTNYKVLYMGRHGEGWHNAAETYYGTPAWNCYYSEMDGNGTVTWADAHLTPNGVKQAQVASNFWASEIANQKIPVPQSYYVSPLTRCLQTANITFSTVKLPRQYPFIPLIKEYFREGISGHTCDRRSNRTYIHDSFPGYRIEKGFSELDLLWKPLLGEVATDQDIRSRTVLDQVFRSDDAPYISITSHSGELASVLRGGASADFDGGLDEFINLSWDYEESARSWVHVTGLFVREGENTFFDDLKRSSQFLTDIE
ncbi:Sedoheptulose-bisphosphatase/4-nitrophenylphosphatase [Chlorociboria aeruginascens]|nr:Sedoheptulose-bisphosphatase/4-nitrophenylphosphatase [Chlorociboria aeruginascens]